MKTKPTLTITAEVCYLLESVKNLQSQLTPSPLGLPAQVNIWLFALLKANDRIFADLIDTPAEALSKKLRDSIAIGKSKTETLTIEAALAAARKLAEESGSLEITPRTLIQAVIKQSRLLSPESNTPARPVVSLHPPTIKAPAKEPDHPPVSLRPIPTLLQFGRDLTREARDGKLSHIVGRERELELMIETLCRRTKRNPVLVGPAGVGKTAIVEGLAQKIVHGTVPQPLQGVTLVMLQPSLIVAGTKYFGDLEKRIEPILEEASQPGVILFIDELHMIIGAGGREGTGDIANLLKPALARGDIACIAATTDDEYRRYIEADSALERRFYPVRIQEMTAEQAMYVLRSIRDELTRDTGVEVRDDVLHILTDYAICYMHNRNFPDKAIDLLEQSVAYARTNNLDSVDAGDAETVVQQMIGMPLHIKDRIANLHALITTRYLMCEDDMDKLVSRLQVSMRGLDLCSDRPNAIILLIDAAAQNGLLLSETISSTLFETGGRVISIDLAQMKRMEDISTLTGTPPGYVGYDQQLPLHKVKQFPWCIILFENLDKCHPHVVQTLARSFRTGYLTMADGQKIYLCDTVIILTAPDVKKSTGKNIGFDTYPSQSRHQDVTDAVEKIFGAELVNTVDIVCSTNPSNGDASCSEWALHEILDELKVKYRRYKLEVAWDSSLIEWLESSQTRQMCKDEWERLVDGLLTPNLLPYLENRLDTRQISVSYDGKAISIN